MNLTIDIGNSSTKFAVFHNNDLTHFDVVDHIAVEMLQNIFDKFDITATVISSVKNDDQSVMDFLSENFNLIKLVPDLPLPIKNCYKTPESLGNDRIANAVAGNHFHQDQNILIIDIGTCITYDFVNDKREYVGGGISPGIELRYKSLNTFTDKLPLVVQNNEDELIGTTTERSITSGVQNGIIAEVDGIIDQYKMKHSDINVIITGGDSNFFEKRLKNPIFVRPKLLLEGLNVILNYNLELTSR